MDRKTFSALLKNKRLLLDGATGTELAAAGMPQGIAPELWTAENPEYITKLQRSYVAAGSNIVYAPTFGGNAIKLAAYGLEKQHDQLNRTLLQYSKEAVKNSDCLVFGDISSTGELMEPYGDLAEEKAMEVFAKQSAVLIEAGADGIVVETMMDLNEASAAVRAIRKAFNNIPLILSMTFAGNGRTLFGNSLSDVLCDESLDVDAAGCNCSSGPAKMVEILREAAGNNPRRIPLLAKPNAGMPHLVEGKTIFDLKAAEFAEECADFMDIDDIRMIGGCCGSGPEHIAELKKRIF